MKETPFRKDLGRKRAGIADCYRWISAVLTPPDRGRWKGLMLLSATVGLFEAFGVLSILPFLAILSEPELLEKPGVISRLYELSGIDNTAEFQFALGILVFVILVLGVGLRMGRIVLLTRFARRQAVVLSVQLLRSYLHRTYAWLLQQHGSGISAGVLYEVERVATGAISSSIELIANATVLLSVLAILLIADPVAALFVIVAIGGAYGVIILAAGRQLRKIGAARKAANRARFAIVNELLGGIKEVKLLKLEETFLELFRADAWKAANARAKIKQISELPRSLLEILVFGSMLGFVLIVLAREDNDWMAAIPVIGLFAFAGVRTFPVLQAFYRAYSVLQSDAPVLESLYSETAPTSVRPSDRRRADRLPLLREIELRGVVFAYENSREAKIEIPRARIAAGKIVAIAGPSGSGKSTLVDILLGLLEPTEGTVLIDGVVLDNNNREAWQANIGYVPQQVYLLDDTVAANIVFGRDTVPDDDRVRRAARDASIDTFIESLPDGYQTRVGERGVLLSGGQAQRIAIARALYDDPQVLVLDEPTSALDHAAERDILERLVERSNARTVLIVSHRESTIRKCTQVLWLSDGHLVDDRQPQSGAT